MNQTCGNCIFFKIHNAIYGKCTAVYPMWVAPHDNGEDEVNNEGWVRPQFTDCRAWQEKK